MYKYVSVGASLATTCVGIELRTNSQALTKSEAKVRKFMHTANEIITDEYINQFGEDSKELHAWEAFIEDLDETRLS